MKQDKYCYTVLNILRDKGYNAIICLRSGKLLVLITSMNYVLNRQDYRDTETLQDLSTLVPLVL